MKIDDLKSRHTVESVLQGRGIFLKKGMCPCPFHDDRSPSFSVKNDHWKCFAGCGSGDVADLLAKLNGVSMAQLLKNHSTAGSGTLKMAQHPWDPMKHKLAEAADAEEKRQKRENWPEFQPGSKKELEQLSRLRGIVPEGLKIAQDRGLLWFSDWQEHRCWIVTDDRRINAQARRLDGGKLRVTSGEAKAQTLPGSQAAWPIGLGETSNYPNVALVEGGPDLLTAHGFMWVEDRSDVAVVGMLGASHRPSVEIWKALGQKKVRIFVHSDTAGWTASRDWAKALKKAGVSYVDGCQFEGLRQIDGTPVEDLNDLLKIGPDDFEERRDIWEVLP